MENAMAVMWENLMGNHSKPFKSIFKSNESSFTGDVDSHDPVPQLSPLLIPSSLAVQRGFMQSHKEFKYAIDTSTVNVQLADGEVVIDVDGTNPIQPVLQHMGI